MSTDPPPKETPPDLSALNRLNSTAAAYWTAMLTLAGVLALLWLKRGPGHPVVALLVATWTFFLTPGVAIPAFRRLPPGWCRVPASERILHRILGVSIFGWLLERSGWNRNNAFLASISPVTRARLQDRVIAVRGGGAAHGVCFAMHLILAAIALCSGYSWGALWILLPGVVIHLYPVLLQRSVMLRLQPLLEKTAGNGL